MSQNPLISILIATKNRQFFCFEAIKSIVNLKFDNIEICISDNSDNNQLQKQIADLNIDYLNYKYTNDKISFIENFNRCMDMSKGKYVTLIGDDDCILPSTIDYVKYADENNLESISSVNNISYYWPGALDNFPNGMEEIVIERKKIVKYNPKNYLKDLLKNGLQHYLLYPLPRVYHGIIRRDKMLEVKERTGNFFGGLSPDIYASISLSCIIKEHYTTTEPLSIAGVCGNSASAKNIKGKHSGEMSESPLLNNINNYDWEKSIPYFYSVNTIWAESAMKAIVDMNESALITYFNKYRLMAHSVINNRKFIPEILKREQNKIRVESGFNNIFFTYKMSLEYIIIVAKKIKYIFNNISKNKNKKIYTNVSNIKDAIDNYILTTKK